MSVKKQSIIFSISTGVGCYRHICVSANETLEEFADIILSAFDFFNDHAHMFCMDNQVWSEDDCYYAEWVDLDQEYRHTCDYKLSQLGLEKGDRFKMIFDFGDDWRFQCKVLRIIEEEFEEVKMLKSVGKAPIQYPDY
ncbi:IS1096 element passenger TnpR family protein [Enterococcus faecalis]|uniref:IS1096 element passenger TnpR family protein n=1 Tax=Enterococcus faecalis TaxID=1351 RepID=UPI001A96E200|nr:hypothetical protein [Enterococcus faecalis]MBO1136469.1 plasmid pRiA4b ORF-3 family protein [Enterococcus faecalis]